MGCRGWRTARFVMNSQLVTAGYPWVVIPVERRQEYMAALEQASVEGNIEWFVRFVGRVMGKLYLNFLITMSLNKEICIFAKTKTT